MSDRPSRPESIRVGLALLLVLAATGCGAEPPAEPLPDLPPEGRTVLEGRVEVFGGGPVPSGLEVQLRALDLRASAGVGSDGTFRLAVDHDLAGTPTGILVAPSDPAAGAHLPAYWHFRSGLPRGVFEIALLPRVWPIEGGALAGEAVELSPAGAFGKTCGRCPVFWSADPARLDPPAIHWPADAFPLPVALDHGASTHDLTEADSLDLWASIAEWEAGLDRDLFRPARVEDFPQVEYTNLGRQGLVSVRVADGAEFSATGLGFDSETRVLDFATVGINRPGAFGEVVTKHELGHTLGLDHTCGWRTLLFGVCGDASPELTPEDVAHIQVFLEQNARREAATGIFLGFRAAYRGSVFERDSLPGG